MNPLVKYRQFFAGAAFCAAIVVTYSLWPSVESSPSHPDTVAIVEGEQITAAQFKLAWEKQQAPDTPENRLVLLQKLIERTALTQKATSQGIDQEAALKADWQSLLISHLKEREIHEQIRQIKISEEELKTHYEEIKDQRFSRPAKRKVAALWLNSRGKEPLEKRYQAKLQAALDLSNQSSPELNEGFGNLALSNTEDRKSRFKGGVIGWLQADNTRNAWRNRLWKISKSLENLGDFSEVEIHPEGVFVVRLLETTEAQYAPFEQVASELRRSEKFRRIKQLERQFRQSAVNSKSIEIFKDNLSSIDLPSSSRAATAAR